ncbi:hypothetical protein ABT075_11700 [Streptomyces sp. NPDC002677]|uniref:hypothetical protein n=1 Tax=Streptomyces sp. NPDC002677 TaxID=3154774 RepID=UPI0033327156
MVVPIGLLGRLPLYMAGRRDGSRRHLAGRGQGVLRPHRSPRRARSADRSPALALDAAPHQVRAEHPGREEQFGAFMHIGA